MRGGSPARNGATQSRQVRGAAHAAAHRHPSRRRHNRCRRYLWRRREYRRPPRSSRRGRRHLHFRPGLRPGGRQAAAFLSRARCADAEEHRKAGRGLWRRHRRSRRSRRTGPDGAQGRLLPGARRRAARLRGCRPRAAAGEDGELDESRRIRLGEFDQSPSLRRARARLHAAALRCARQRAVRLGRRGYLARRLGYRSGNRRRRGRIGSFPAVCHIAGLRHLHRGRA